MVFRGIEPFSECSSVESQSWKLLFGKRLLVFILNTWHISRLAMKVILKISEEWQEMFGVFLFRIPLTCLSATSNLWNLWVHRFFCKFKQMYFIKSEEKHFANELMILGATAFAANFKLLNTWKKKYFVPKELLNCRISVLVYGLPRSAAAIPKCYCTIECHCPSAVQTLWLFPFFFFNLISQ